MKNGWGIEATFGNPKASGIQPFSSMFFSLLLPGCVCGMTALSFTSDVSPLSIRTVVSVS